MATNTGRIKLGIDFNVNKAGLDQAKKAIQELKTMSKEQIESSGGSILSMSDNAMKSWKNDLGAMRKELDALDKAMEDAFNPKLGIYELEKFNASLKQSGTSAERALATVGAYGKAGEAALLNMTTQMLATDRAAKQVHSTFQKLGDTMMNTIRWSITSSAINLVTGSIQSAYNYAVSLDKSLNDIMIVTDKSAEDMERFARSANKAAKSLGASTRDYTSASLIYYQQGLSDEETKARTETTLKAAAVTGQSASAVSEQLTAVWNGYKVSADEAELYIDKLSAVAATTASDLEELSTGMSKVASAANVMGVDVDQLNAQLATIISVTRQAPESVGTALKTVYARMSDIEAGIDTETTLSEYTSQMAEMGVNVLDAQGHLRDMGDVIEEIGFKWNSLNKEQQVSLAQTIAGTRQYNNMMALFDNWDMYEKSLATSMRSVGALSAQHMDYLEGVEAHQEKLRASAEGLYQSLFKSDEINAVYDVLTGIVTLVDELVQSLGGMPGVLAAVGMLFAKAAKNSIADFAAKQKENKLNNEMYRSQIQNGKEIIEQQRKKIKASDEVDAHLQKVLSLEEQIYAKADSLTDDQWDTLQEGVRNYNALVQKTIDLENELQNARQEANTTFSSSSAVAYKTYTKDGKTEIRKQKAEELVKGSGVFYLWSSESMNEEDKKTKKKTLGLQQARDRRNLLQEQKIKQGLNKEQETELKLLERRISKAEKENEIYNRAIELEQTHTKAIKENIDATDRLGQSTEDFLNKSLSGNKFANIIDNLTSIAFTATAVSQSFSELWVDIASGEVTIASITTGFLTFAGTIAYTVASGISNIKAAQVALEKVRNTALETAAAAELMWAKLTLGVSLAITAITTVVSIISNSNEKEKQAEEERKKRKLERAQASLEEAQANEKLLQSYLNAYEIYKKTGDEKERLLELASQLAETYKNQEIQNLALAGSYDALAESVRKARIEENETAIKNAKQIQAMYEDKLNEVGIMTRLIGGVLVPDEDKEDYWKMLPADQVSYLSKIGVLTSVTSDVLDYEDSTATLQAEQAKGVAYKAGLENASLSEFIEKRKELIQQELKSRGLEEGTDEWKKEWDAVAQTINSAFKELEGNTPQLTLRTQYLEGLRVSGMSESMITQLQDLMDLDNFGETEFNALQLIDKDQYANDAEGLIQAARQKAKQIRGQRLVDSQEAILTESNSRIEELERQENKAAGLDKVAIIQSQNKELDKQIELLEEIQKQTLATNKTSAQQDFVDLANKYGFTHNLKVGVDENWDPMAIYNAIETAVTDGELNAGEADALQKLLFGAVLDSQNQYQEGIDKINTLKDTKHSNTLNEFDIKLNVKIDENKAQKEYTDFLRGFTKDDSYIDLVKFDKESFYDAYKSLQDYRTSLTELEQSDADEAYKKEKRQEIISAMMQDVNSLLSARNQLEETYLSYQDAINESYEQYLSLIENANGLLEHQVTMMELIYGDKAFKYMENYYAEQIKNSQLVNMINKQRYGQDKADYEGLLAKGLDLSDPKVQDARDKYLVSGEAYAASLAETAQNYAEQYNNTIENILDNFTSSMLSEEAMKEWDWSQKMSDMFLDEVDEAYLKSRLSRSFDKAIKESSSVKAQQALNKAREEELKLLKEKDKLTQYDLDRAQKRLDIEIARLALEDARDAKTKMRLMRGSDGTYSYQYVTDQSAIDEKQSQYEEALKTRYDADETELQNQVNKSNELLNNMKEEIAALNPASETYEQDLQDIKERYLPLLQAQGMNVLRVTSNLQSSSQNLSELYGTDVISPLLNSQALQSIIAWGNKDQNGLEQMFEDVTKAQTDAATGITNSADMLKIITNQLYLAIMGREDDLSTAEDERVKGLLDAQEKQIEKLGQMNTAMTGVVTTLGLLDTAIKVAKGDVQSDSNATMLTDLYDIAISEAGVVTMTKKAAAYDTGGYTGTWGSEGKFLLAHEKELILNQADTRNILKAVDIVRSLNSSMLNTVSEMGRGYDLPMAAWELAKELVIEQNVYISAEFPTASDRSEIEAAFEELMLLATQHAFDSTKD